MTPPEQFIGPTHTYAEPQAESTAKIMVPMYMGKCKHCNAPIGTTEVEGHMQPWVHVLTQQKECE